MCPPSGLVDPWGSGGFADFTALATIFGPKQSGSDPLPDRCKLVQVWNPVANR
ncbi:hypothetical protein BgiMline_009569, partial [Biomphalaria glabrata]